MLTWLKEKMQSRLRVIGTYTMSQFVLRLLTAFGLVLLYVFMQTETLFTDKGYYGAIDLSLFLLFTLLLFDLFCFIDQDNFFTILLILTVTLYFVLVSKDVKDYAFSFGLCAVLLVIIYFFDTEKAAMEIGRPILWGTASVLMVGATLFVGIICCLYYKNYATPNYDFGIFAQMFYHMKESGEQLVTCERDHLLSHFAVHCSPIYYVLLPLYWLFPDPATLLMAQAVIVASGAVPLILLCKRFDLSNGAALLFAVCYLLYPSFLGGSFYYLHENCFLAPLLLWYLYFAESRRTGPMIAFAALTLLVKEDAPVYVAVVALYLILADKQRKGNLAVLALAIAYFAVTTHLMGVYGLGIMSDSRYGNYIYDDGGIFTVIKAVIQNPAYAVLQIFKTEKWLFILQTMVPLMGLPLAIKKPAKLLLFIPLLLVNLMTSYGYQYNIGYQYVFGSGTLLFYLAVSNYAELGAKRHKLLLCAALGSVVIFAGGYFSKTGYIESYKNAAETRQIIDNALELVPEDASVAASTFLLPNLSQRAVIYELETTKHIAEVEYIVVDMRSEKGRTAAETYRTDEYETVAYEQNAVAVFRRAE